VGVAFFASFRQARLLVRRAHEPDVAASTPTADSQHQPLTITRQITKMLPLA